MLLFRKGGLVLGCLGVRIMDLDSSSSLSHICWDPDDSSCHWVGVRRVRVCIYFVTLRLVKFMMRSSIFVSTW